MIVTPFMSCSARLPIYVLFSDMFFGKYAAIVAFSMYVIGMAIAILVAKVIHYFYRIHRYMVRVEFWSSRAG